jgi:DNA polymerase-3 subunit delta
MLYVFYGKDTFTLGEKLAELRASLDEDGALATNTVHLDGRRTTLAEVTAACDTVPFLGSHRLVIVEGLLSRLAGRKGAEPSGDVDAWLPLADYADRMPPSSHLVLVDGDVTAANPLLKALGRKARVSEFRPLKQGAVAGWLRARAQAGGLKISQKAVALLAESVGEDLWTLSSELEKLSAYANGEPVDEEDVRALVSAVRETSVFALVDAIVEGRQAAAVRLLRQMFREGRAIPYILSMVQRQLRLIAIAREMVDAGASAAAIGEAVRLPPYPRDRLLDQARRYSAARLRAAFQRLLDADLQVKRGVYSDELALELLVHDLAAA